jgi:hypothetical protein
MKRHLTACIRLFLLTVIVAAGGPACADAMLYTPPVSNPPHRAQGARCALVNLSNETRTITIEAMMAGEGGPGAITAQVLAGDSISVPFPVCGDECDIYCRFSVRGDKREYRASLCDSHSGCLAAE